MPDPLPATPDAPTVLAVTVAYSSAHVIGAMAASLPPGVRLAVVDNGPDDGARAWARAAGHLLVEPGRNLGFGTACNRGAAAADSDFLLFINPDARLAPGALAALLDAARAHPEASAFGPAVCRADGSVYRYRPSILLGRAAALKYRARPQRVTAVPSLNGACFLVRRAAFAAVGGFDEKIFLFFEDDDLSLRLSETQGPLLYVPTARVEHASGGSSVERPETARLKGFHYAWSYVYIQRKRGRRLAWPRAALRVLRRLISARMVKSPPYRNYALGQWKGLMASLR